MARRRRTEAPPPAPSATMRADASQEAQVEAAARTATTSNGRGEVTPPLESVNPATGEPIGAVATLAPEQVQAVVDDVAEVQPFWAELPLSDRARYMRRTAQVLIDNLDGL